MKKILLLALLTAFVAILGWRLYEETSAESAGGPGGFRVNRPSMLVETAPVEPELFESNLVVLGELRPRASVDVMSRVSGRLDRLLVERGDAVRQGQLLAQVDDSDIVQQILQAEAAIAVARAGVSREEATTENLRIQVKRYRDLHGESLISTQDLEDLESRLRASEAQVELARAQVRQAEANLNELEIQQENSRIHSPLTGFVGTRYLDPGALVSPSTAIVSVLDVSRVKTVVPVAEEVIPQIHAGLPAEIVVDAYPERVYRGSITRVSPFLDPGTRSADVEIEVGNPNGSLKPGMFARVNIDANISRSSLSIPRAALLTRGENKGVYVLSDENTTVFRDVEVGRIEGDVVEIVSGLEEGLQVVTSGAQSLNEGDKVKLR